MNIENILNIIKNIKLIGLLFENTDAEKNAIEVSTV
jgi:hypothetical protein